MIDVNVSVNGCLVTICQPCDELATCPVSNPLPAQCQLGSAPDSRHPEKDKRLWTLEE